MTALNTFTELKARQDVPVITANHQGIITYINSCFIETYGWSESELKGNALTTIIPPTLHDAHNFGFSRFLLTEKPTLLNKPLLLKVMKKDGTQVEAEHFIVAEQNDNEWVFGAMIILKETMKIE